MDNLLLKDTSLRLTADNCITFSLNGKIQKVNGGLPGNTTLLQYIRDVAQLKGTKFMCREGGCGACIVNITFTDPVTLIEKSFSVNSCLLALYSCHGMSVTTVEGIGNQQKGYHPVQTRLANFYGTQCGFCSPGWVMAMYSLLKSNQTLTMEQIENSFGSNNCRCTGYRPILDAFKSFAGDSSLDLKGAVIDIEDLMNICKNPIGKKTPKCKLYLKEPSSIDCDESDEDDLERHFVELALASPSVCIPTAGKTTWYRITTIQEIFEIFTMITGSYILLAGNTAQGIYETKYLPPADSYIDINGVSELRSHMFVSGSLVLGANITLTDTIQLFSAVAVEQPVSFGYLQVLVNHMNKVAHIPVRNVGTLAGNLSSKHDSPRFPSDLFTIFETVGALLVIDSGNGAEKGISLTEYLQTDMYKRVITKIIFQPLDSSYIVKTYKVTRRAQNDHAVVNAGFCFSFDKKNYRVIKNPTIVYGGIRPGFVHATSAEEYLNDKCLLNVTILQKVLSILSLEVNPDRQLPEASIEYRKGLALSLFYRFVLSLNPSEVNPRLVSGGEEISRPLSSGHQEYGSHPEQYPLTQPIPKLESLIQCSGEIQYTNDILPVENELYAALVLADCGPATLDEIDASAALSIPGVVNFFSAKDIPGTNSYVNLFMPYIVEHFELFVCEKIRYAGQCVGVILAISQDLADFAAVRVVIKSRSTGRPVLSIKDVLKARETQRIKPVATIEPSTKKDDLVYSIKGNCYNKGQAHFYYETNSCLVRPVDNSKLDIIFSSQAPNSFQEAVSLLLNISSNRIYVRVQRCGGAFGGKITNSLLPACACALAAFLTQRPVRIVMNLQSNLRCLGGRYLSYAEYEVGVNGKGVIQYLNAQYYIDQGASLNDSITANHVVDTFQNNVYDPSTWNVSFYDVLTDKPSTVATRAPGTFEALGTIEHIMQHIASTLKMDLMEVRLNNLQVGSLIPEYWIELREKSNYDQRLEEVRNFNANNQWKKHGLSAVPMLFRVGFRGVHHAMVAIYRYDGTVAISHGGTELGQGINTKVAQVAAYELNIPLSYIQVKAVNTLTSPNDRYTSGSSTTDAVCFAVRNCCQQINVRLGPLRNELGSGVLWSVLIQAAFLANIDLYATYMFVPDQDLVTYPIYGLTALEAEIDCLTGEHKINRADILINSGKSLNAFVDIGQVEGGFLMGLGNYTSEDLMYDPKTGFLLTDRTWEYKIPGAKDIPVEWKVYLKENPNNPPVGVYNSKCNSEAATVMSVAITFAFRLAIESLRQDIGLSDDYICYDSSWTAENIFLRCCAKPKDYVL